MKTLAGIVKLRRLSALLILAFLLFFVSVANAYPTVASSRSTGFAGPSPVSPCTATSGSMDLLDEPACANLSNLAEAFLRPPESGTDSPLLDSNSRKTLPAAPASILMLLTGFLCVSFYRDRRVWLAALMAPLLLSQASIHALPRLAHCFGPDHHSSQKIHGALAHSAHRSHRLRCDMEGSRHAGLLHYLAGIPDVKSVVNSYIFQSAVILKQDILPPLSDCPAPIAEQFRCFSPAFIFQNLARGPPLSSQKRFLSFLECFQECHHETLLENTIF